MFAHVPKCVFVSPVRSRKFEKIPLKVDSAFLTVSFRLTNLRPEGQAIDTDCGRTRVRLNVVYCNDFDNKVTRRVHDCLLREIVFSSCMWSVKADRAFNWFLQFALASSEIMNQSRVDHSSAIFPGLTKSACLNVRLTQWVHLTFVTDCLQIELAKIVRHRLREGNIRMNMSRVLITSVSSRHIFLECSTMFWSNFSRDPSS